jgi:chromosome segregation ATPase
MKKSDLKSYIRENIINILSEDLDEKEEQVDRIAKKVEDLTNQIDNIQLEEEDDDKDAIKAAEKARGKNKKYDIVLDKFKKVETEMRSLARDYSKASGVQKDNLLKKLKDLTKIKNELKQEVEKYAEKLV